MIWEKFQEICNKDLESGNPTLSTQHDECAAQLFASDSAAHTQMEYAGILVELLETGSVTVKVGEKNYVVWLNVQEETMDESCGNCEGKGYDLETKGAHPDTTARRQCHACNGTGRKQS